MKPWVRRVARVAMLSIAALLAQPGECASDVVSPPAGQPLQQPGEGIVAGTLVLDFGGSSPEMQKMVATDSALSIWIRLADDTSAPTYRFETSSDGWSTPGLARQTATDRRLLFFRALPPGTYAILGFQAHVRGAFATSAPVALPPRFTVAPDTVTYIGAGVMKAHVGERAAPWSVSLAIDDDVDDDSLHLYHVRPELRALPLRDAVSGELKPAPGLADEAEVNGAAAVNGDLPAMDVASVKAGAGIPPAVFAKLEAFHPSTPPAGAGTLRRIVLHHSVTRDGKKAGANTRTLTFLDTPGYLLDSTATVAGTTQALEYMPFVVVQSRAARHVEATSMFHMDVDSASSTTLVDVTLPAFDTALAPGANWTIESQSDTSVHSKNLIQAIDRSNFAIVKRLCTTTERQPASTLSPELAGTMLTVSCQQVDRPGDELAMAYLEHYGVFALLRQSVSLPPKGTLLVSTYKVVRVELAKPAADATGAPAQ